MPAKSDKSQAKQPSRPALALVKNIHSRPRSAAIQELQDLLALAQSGELIGLSYTYVTRTQQVRAGMAGVTVKDPWRAAGALFATTIEATQIANGDDR